MDSGAANLGACCGFPEGTCLLLPVLPGLPPPDADPVPLKQQAGLQEVR